MTLISSTVSPKTHLKSRLCGNPEARLFKPYLSPAFTYLPSSLAMQIKHVQSIAELFFWYLHTCTGITASGKPQIPSQPFWSQQPRDAPSFGMRIAPCTLWNALFRVYGQLSDKTLHIISELSIQEEPSICWCYEGILGWVVLWYFIGSILRNIHINFGPGKS